MVVNDSSLCNLEHRFDSVVAWETCVLTRCVLYWRFNCSNLHLVTFPSILVLASYCRATSLRYLTTFNFFFSKSSLLRESNPSSQCCWLSGFKESALGTSNVHKLQDARGWFSFARTRLALTFIEHTLFAFLAKPLSKSTIFHTAVTCFLYELS